MAVDEVRARARNELAEAMSVETADYVLDRPPGGWSDLATKQDLAALEARIDRRFSDQTTIFNTKLDALGERITSGNSSLSERITSGNSLLGERITSGNSSLRERITSGNSSLGERITSGDSLLRAEMADQFRAQTWRLITAMLATMSILVAAMVAAVKL